MMDKFVCKKCGKKFKRKENLYYHINKRKISCEKRLLTTKCEYCEKVFSTKPNLRKHLTRCKSKKNKECENIELHKKMNTSFAVDEGCIYLLIEREFIKSNENVYKLGRTQQNDNKRLKQYPKGSKLIFQINCDNHKNIEHVLLNMFDCEFINRKDIGREYYEGNSKKMILKILSVIDIKCDDDYTFDFEKVGREYVKACKSFVKMYRTIGINYKECKEFTKNLIVQDGFGDDISHVYELYVEWCIIKYGCFSNILEKSDFRFFLEENGYTIKKNKLFGWELLLSFGDIMSLVIQRFVYEIMIIQTRIIAVFRTSIIVILRKAKIDK